MPYPELANYGALGIITGVLLWFLIRTCTQSLRDLAKQHKEIIDLSCHNQDIQKEHKEAMKEIVVSLKSINGK